MSDDRIFEGKTLVIPGGAASTDSSAPKKPAKYTPVSPTRPPSEGAVKIQTISVGSKNNVKDPVLLNSDLGTPAAAGGAVSSLPPSVEPAAPGTPEPSTLEQAFEYVVMDGETLEDIARAFIVSVDDVRDLNALDPEVPVKPGQTLKIPPSVF
jgi:LysM repeat protein